MNERNEGNNTESNDKSVIIRSIRVHPCAIDSK